MPKKKTKIERDPPADKTTVEAENVPHKRKVRAGNVRDSLDYAKRNKGVLISEDETERDQSEFTRQVGTLRQESESDSSQIEQDFSFNNSSVLESDCSQNSENKGVDGSDEVSHSSNLARFFMLGLLFFAPFLAYSCSTMQGSVSSELNKMLDLELLRFSPFLLPNKQNELKRNILAKLITQKDSDPLSIFIMSDKNQQENLTSFASNLAHIFSKFNTQPKASNYFVLPSKNHYGKDLDTVLDQKLETDIAALVVEDFTGVSWEQAKLFLRYCDNGNAPYQDRLFIFTAIVSECNPLRPDASIEGALLNTWQEFEEDETIEALSARITAVSVCFQ